MAKPWHVIALPMIAEADEGWRKKGDLLCPERYSMAEVMDLKNSDAQVWSTHYQLHPSVGGGTWFKKEDLRFYKEVDPHKLFIYIIIDPALSKKTNSDFTTMGVIGTGADMNFYWLEVVHKRLNPTERAYALFDLRKRWTRRGGHPVRRVGYEEYGLQADTFDLEREMDAQSYHFDIQVLGRAGKWHNMDKPERIRTLMSIGEQHRLYLPALESGLTQEQHENIVYFIEHEWEPYPAVDYDDVLDVLSRVNDPDMGVEFPLPEEDDGDGEHEYSGASWLSR